MGNGKWGKALATQIYYLLNTYILVIDFLVLDFKFSSPSEAQMKFATQKLCSPHVLGAPHASAVMFKKKEVACSRKTFSFPFGFEIRWNEESDEIETEMQNYSELKLNAMEYRIPNRWDIFCTIILNYEYDYCILCKVHYAWFIVYIIEWPVCVSLKLKVPSVNFYFSMLRIHYTLHHFLFTYCRLFNIRIGGNF